MIGCKFIRVEDVVNPLGCHPLFGVDVAHQVAGVHWTLFKHIMQPQALCEQAVRKVSWLGVKVSHEDHYI